MRIYLILPLYHEFLNSKHFLILHTPFCKAFFQLNEIPKRIIGNWWAHQNREYFERLIEIFKGVVTYIIQFNIPKTTADNVYISYEPNLELCLKMLQFLFRLNHQQRIDKVPYDIFHLTELMEVANIQHDYLFWLMDHNVIFSIT